MFQSWKLAGLRGNVRVGVEVERLGSGVVLREGGKVFAYADKNQNGKKPVYGFLTPTTELQQDAMRLAQQLGFVMDDYPADTTYVSPNGRVWVSLFRGHYDISEVEYVNLNPQSQNV